MSGKLDKNSLTILLILAGLIFLALFVGSSATLAHGNLDSGPFIDGDIRHFALQSPQNITVNAEADARVLEVSPDTNDGTLTRLDVDSPGPSEEPLLTYSRKVAFRTVPVTPVTLKRI